MKEVLLIICYIKLSHEGLLNSIKSGGLGTTNTSSILDSTNVHRPGQNVRLSTETSSSLPEISLTAKSVKKYKSQNGYKNQRGYTLNEQFHDKDGPSSERPNFTTKTIHDSRFVYHSRTNPLFKSGTINLKSIGNDDPSSKINGDTTLHKISNPFDTKWLLLPGENTPKDGNDKLSSSTTDLNSIFDAMRNSEMDSPLSTSSDDYKFKPTGLAKKTLSLFAKNGAPTLANKTSIVIPQPKVDLQRVDKKLNIFQTKSPVSTKTPTTTTTTPAPLASTEKTFYSYNVEEVKTSDGKTRGTVQIFDEKGLKKNLVYDEKGVIEDKIATKTNGTADKKKEKPNTIFSAVENTATKKNASQIRPQLESVFPQNDNNFASRPIDEIEYNRPLATSGNSFATPEFILYDFLGRLGSASPYIPNNDNFVTNEVGSLDEAVNENSFFYSVKK